MAIKTKNLITAALFTGLTAISAFIKIPLPIVPITLQGMIILLAGLTLEPGTALLSQIAYIAIGLSGVPVFTEGGGVQYILSPTFGYLIANIPAVLATASIRKKRNDLYLIPALTGLIIIYVIGSIVLFINLNLVAKIETSIKYAFQIGTMPFIIPDLIKALAAISIAKKINKDK